MKSIIIFALLITTIIAQEYTGNIRSVTVTDTSVEIVTMHDGVIYNGDFKYIKDTYIIKNKKFEKMIDTAEVTPSVKEKLTWKKDKIK